MADGKPIRPEWAALEYVQTAADAEVALASPPDGWNSIAASRIKLGKVDVSLPALGVPAFGINYGPDLRLERVLHGRRVGGCGTAGYLSLLPPDADTRWLFDKPGDIVLVFLNRELFDAAIEDHTGRPARLVEVVPRFVIRDLVLERIAHTLLGEIADPQPGSRLRTEGLAQELAAHLIAAHSTMSRTGEVAQHSLSPGRLRRVQEFIAANLAADLSLSDIAGAAGMSLFHFAKAFKKASGLSPHQYLKQQRLHRARTLLHDRGLSISAVAGSVGLSHSYFTAAFHERMGMTPSRFRDVLYT